jgi:hypothetical protein
MILDRLQGWRAFRALAFALALTAAPTMVAAQEYEPYDEDEWYDPTDWFDGNNVEWDDTYEWYDEGLDDHDDLYGYDNGYYDDGFYDYYDYDGYYDYGYDDYRGYGYDDYYGYDYDDYYDYDGDHGFHDDGYDYGWHYEWDPMENEWSRAYGWYDEYYDDYSGGFSDDPQYGWHYEWDSIRDEWDRVYGWYDEYYESGQDFDRYQGTGDRRPDQRTSTSQRQTTVTGVVDGFSRMSTDGDRVLVRLRLRDGRTRVVDLGSQMELSRLGLNRGDSVTIRGDPIMRQGDQVLRASMIEVAGQPFRIARDTSGSSMRGGQGRGDMRGDQSGRSDTRSGQGRSREMQGSMADRGGQSSQTTTFEGRLEAFKKVQSPQGERVLVRLNMQDGSKRVVDFGSESRFRELDLKRGERVVVRGNTRQVDGEKVLVAQQVQTGMDQGQGRGAGRQGSSSQDTRTLSGEIRQVQRTRIEGLPSSHTVLKLQLDSGRTHVVDLGQTDLQRLGIGEGDQLRLSGRPRQISGQTVIDANDLRLNGRSIAIDGQGDSGRPIEAGSRRRQD